MARREFSGGGPTLHPPTLQEDNSTQKLDSSVHAGSSTRKTVNLNCTLQLFILYANQPYMAKIRH